MPYKDKQQQSNYQRSWLARLVALGLCSQCREDRGKSKYRNLCGKCGEKHRKSNLRWQKTRGKQTREERIAKGLCPDCSRKAAKGKKYCAVCQERKNEGKRRARKGS